MVERRSVRLILLISLLASSSAVALTYSLLTKTLTTSGTITAPATSPPAPAPPPAVNIGFYSDRNCAIPITSIDWGILSPGSSKTVTIYLRNEGSVGLTLSINMANVNPTAVSKYLSLSTDYDGRTISPNQVLALALTLWVTQDAQGSSFSFHIAITFG